MEQSLKIKLAPELEIELPLIQTEEFAYYSFNMLGQARWNNTIAKVLYKKNNEINITPDIIITVEAKAIGLAEELSNLYGIERYIVLRKNRKSYMKKPISFSGKTIISGQITLCIDEEDIDILNNKKVLIVDDVVSTGGTLTTIIEILNYCKCTILAINCALTEGIIRKDYKGIQLLSCGHIPLYKKNI